MHSELQPASTESQETTVQGLSELQEPFAPIVTRLVTERPASLGLGNAPLCKAIPHQIYHGPYSKVLELELCTEHANWRGFVKSATGSLGLLEAPDETQGPTQEEFDLLSSLSDAFEDSPQFSTPKPIAFYPDLSSIITQDVGGRSFSEELRTHANFVTWPAALEQLAETCRRIGQWLLKFQSITSTPTAVLLDLDEMREYIDFRLKHLVEMKILGIDAGWRMGILDFFERVAPTISESDRATAGVHGDFSLGNVLVSDDRIAVIDFERFSYGSVMYDLSHLHHHLFHLRSNPRYRGRVARKLSKALLQGYDPQFNIMAPLFRLYQIEHAVCMLIELSRTGNDSKIDSLHRNYICRQYLQYISKIANGVVAA